tara:strand:- start:23 stop:334 length:312 start_codon:yes stop_codon:yes gene_type:complete
MKTKKKNLAKSWGEWIRNHPQTPSLLQKIFDTAMLDGDDNQWRAINVLIDRIAPHLKSVEMDVKGEISQGVIVLPEKKAKKQNTKDRPPVSEDKIIEDIGAEA